MSSSKSDESQNPSSDPTPDHLKTPELNDPNQENKNQEQDEEEGECGFCLFMKGGGCKQVFINWEKCIEEGEKNKEDIVDKCFEVTSVLKKCMEANSEYYGPILKAEKAAEQEAINQLNKEKEKDAAAASGSLEQKDAAAAPGSKDAAGSGEHKDAAAASGSKDAAAASGSGVDKDAAGAS